MKIIFHPRFYEIYTHDPALKLDSINTFYGLSHILFDVCLDTNQGEVVVLLGRNGAGKSTTFRSVIGLTPPRTGKVFFKEKNITQRPSFQIARVGIGFVPRGQKDIHRFVRHREFGSCHQETLSCWHGMDDRSDLRVVSCSRKTRSPKRWNFEWRGTTNADKTIGRTLMGNPELLLLDEPMEGLAPLVVKMIEALVTQLKREGLTILLSEQNVGFSVKVGDRAYVIDDGRIRYHDSMQNLKANEEIKRKYLAV